MIFDIHWNATYLCLAAGVAFVCDFFLTWLLHLRYDRQFGWSFVASGLVAFSLPMLILVGLPVYLVLISALPLAAKIAVLALLGLVLARLGSKLARRLLSKIFYRPGHSQAKGS